MTRTPRLFFSFRSPFSWLLVKRMDRVAPGLFDELDLVPYWEPDECTERALAERGAAIHYAAMSKAKHLYILQDTKRIATGLGLDMRWPVDHHPWWEPSHLLWLHARRAGLARACYDAIVDARWGRGEDVSDPETMLAVAGAIGLELATAPWEDADVRAAGADALCEAHADDVFGVPYMKLGWRRFWGFDRLDAFLAALDADAGRRRVGAVVGGPPDVPAYDTDLAGGCG